MMSASRKQYRLRALFLLGLLVGGSGCATKSATASAGKQPAIAQVKGIENFGVVSPDVWRGGKPTREGFSALAAMGVKTVIDLQEWDESADIPSGVAYVPIRTPAWRADAVDTAAVVAAIRESPKPVFVHCLQGRDRTGLAVAAYRNSEGTPREQVIDELRAYHVNFWWRGPIERRVRDMYRARSAG